MKKIIAIIAFALMSVVAFGQFVEVEKLPFGEETRCIYFKDIDKGFKYDFVSAAYMEHLLGIIVEHYQSFCFVVEKNPYGEPQPEFKHRYGKKEHDLVCDIRRELENYGDRARKLGVKTDKIRYAVEFFERLDFQYVVEGNTFSLNK